MQLATFHDETGPRVGLIDGATVHPFPPGLDMQTVIAGGLERAHTLAAQARGAAPVLLETVSLQAPLAPRSMRDFVAFEEHVDGVRRSVDQKTGVPDAWYDAPAFYFTNPHTVLGPGADVPFPAASTARDFELEVAVIVGADVGSIDADQARSTIFGYTILNDWSARDLQSREMQVGLGPAKGKDFASSLGPWIVTADELEPHRDPDGFLALWCTASVNGTEIGRDLLSNMGWTFETMIAYASRDSLLRAGDVLGSGTVGNGGCMAELWGRHGSQDPPPLRDGDVVTLTVEGIGSLTNTVVTNPTPPTVPGPRRRNPTAARQAGRR